MTEIDTAKQKARLEEERDRLQTQLAASGKQTPQGDWQGASGDYDDNQGDAADPNTVADQIEELATNVPIVEELEDRLQQVNKALDRIDEGTYGTCEVGGEPIPTARLEANPAATTCVEHAS